MTSTQDLNPGHIGGGQVLSSLRHSCSPREIARADWTYLIFLSFVNATTIAVSLTFPLRVQNLASFTEAAFLALTGARS